MEDVAASLQHSLKEFINHLEDELGKVWYGLGDMMTLHKFKMWQQIKTPIAIDCFKLNYIKLNSRYDTNEDIDSNWLFKRWALWDWSSLLPGEATWSAGFYCHLNFVIWWKNCHLFNVVAMSNWWKSLSLFQVTRLLVGLWGGTTGCS